MAKSFKNSSDDGTNLQSGDFRSLTSKQKKVYSAIESFIKSRGIPPTVREIGELVGEKTPGAVQGILNRLAQKGVIKRQSGMARSIQIISNYSVYSQHIYIPLVKKITNKNVNDITNMYNIECYNPFPKTLLEDDGNYFMLKCPDSSLNEITYNDCIIVNKKYVLCDNDILLIFYNNHILLRKYKPGKNSTKITLIADSNLIGKENFDKDDIVILGKLVCTIKMY